VNSSLILQIRRAAENRIFYTEHALDRMNEEKDIITFREVREVIFNGAILEDYPEDRRGHSCLMCATTVKGRPVHVVCSPKKDHLVIITVYVPSANRWEEDFRKRRC